MNEITSCPLNIIHTLIITPNNLMHSLKEVSQVLTNDNLPLSANIQNVAKHLALMELHTCLPKRFKISLCR